MCRLAGEAEQPPPQLACPGRLLPTAAQHQVLPSADVARSHALHVGMILALATLVDGSEQRHESVPCRQAQEAARRRLRAVAMQPIPSGLGGMSTAHPVPLVGAFLVAARRLAETQGKPLRELPLPAVRGRDGYDRESSQPTAS